MRPSFCIMVPLFDYGLKSLHRTPPILFELFHQFNYSNTMEWTKRNRLKSFFLKVLFFLFLSILFFVFYFFNQTKEFLKGSTTFTSRAEEVEHFDMSVLILCFQPRYSLSSYLQKDDHSLMTEFLESANYKLGDDITIDFRSKHGQKKQHLVVGRNIYGNSYIALMFQPYKL